MWAGSLQNSPDGPKGQPRLGVTGPQVYFFNRDAQAYIYSLTCTDKNQGKPLMLIDGYVKPFPFDTEERVV